MAAAEPQAPALAPEPATTSTPAPDSGSAQATRPEAPAPVVPAPPSTPAATVNGATTPSAGPVEVPPPPADQPAPADPRAEGHVPEVVPPPIPEADEEMLPGDGDGEGWLELLRDGYCRQLREENEYMEPPPFHRAMHYAANPSDQMVPPGKFPRQALNMQLQLLLRARAGDGVVPGKGPGKGAPGGQCGKGGGAPPYGNAAAPLLNLGPALPQLLAQVQQGQQGQLLLEAAKAILAKAGLKGGKDKGKGFKGKGGKGDKNSKGVQKTINKNKNWDGWDASWSNSNWDWNSWDGWTNWQ